MGGGMRANTDTNSRFELEMELLESLSIPYFFFLHKLIKSVTRDVFASKNILEIIPYLKYSHRTRIFNNKDAISVI